MANQVTVNSGSGNITVTTSRAVIGTVANVASANYANFAGEVVDPSQPNITSVGNLTSLNVTGTTTTGNLIVTGNLQIGNLVANSANYANFAGEAFDVSLANVSGAGNIASINLDGSASNVLYGNGAFAPAATGNVANANYANFSGTAFSVNGSNVSGAVANATFATTAGSANTANSATVANSANSVAGANVSGAVANATYAANAGFATTASSANTANSATVAASANSVALANVSGAGNIASINIDGSSSNVLYGNGIFAPAAGGNTANANYANFAGNAFSVDGGNVVGAVANATFADDAGNANIANIAYSVDGANVSGTVANATFADDAANANIANIAYSVDAANVSGLGNIATINLDGNASNFLDGTGNFVAAPSGANANYANFAGDVVNSAQPNITSVGTLTALAANTTTPINVVSTNGNVSFTTFNNANTAGRRLEFVYNNPVTFNTSVFGATEDGFALFISNNSSGNSFPGNIKGYWQFLTNGNLQHTIGGTGNINVKGATVSGNVNASGIITAPNITANTGIFTGNAAGLTNIPGANVSGIVANANVANIAYSVDAANVSGLGNIATINLDGNASNLLDGTGNWVAIPTGGSSNYANFAGEVVTNAQPNITTVGNLVSLTINDGSSSNTSVFQPTGATVNSNTYISVNQRDIANNSRDAIILANASAFTSYTLNYLPSAGNTIVTGPTIEVNIDDDIGVGNVAVPGGFTFTTYNSGSDLTTGDGNLRTSFSVGDGVTFFNGAPFSGNTALFSTFNYGMSADPASSTLWRSTRRRGNGTTRLSLEPNDYLGNIEWRGARGGGALPTGSRFAKIAPRVDSSYVANTSTQPVGIEFWVTDNTTARSQIFHANGNVTFSNAINASASNIANTQLNSYQETTFAIGNVSGTITPDFNNGSIQSMTLTGNITLNSLGNAVAGRSMTLILTQDSTGSQTLTSSMLFAGASKTLSTAANAIDVISVFYDGTTYYASLSKGYA